MNSIELEQKYAYEVYPKRDLCITRGEGALLFDEEGKQYIDCTAGVGVASLGHGHPAVASVIADQASRLITCPGIFYNDVRARLLEKLAEITPSSLSRGFLCNSGTEAIEAAIKFARLSTGKTGFISAMRGFHGRSLGALSATHKYREEFEPLLPAHQFVPYNKLDKLHAAIDENTAAVILELVQGEGGVRPADPEYVAAVRALCDEHNVLLIIDEIQTGFGRTGAWFACEHYDLQPDIMTMAKAMAGGLPMGAVMCSDKVIPALGKHGSTFGGNPLACSASLTTIEVIANDSLVDRAASMGDRLAAAVSEPGHAIVRDIRQRGLMIGIELKKKVQPVLLRLLEFGVLALPAGPTVLRLLPPLVITEDQVDRAADCINRALSEQTV